MSTDLAFLRQSDLNKIAPLIKNMEAWNAFLLLLQHEEAKLLLAMVRKPNTEELWRIAGKCELLQQLKRTQEKLIALEKELSNGHK